VSERSGEEFVSARVLRRGARSVCRGDRGSSTLEDEEGGENGHLSNRPKLRGAQTRHGAYTVGGHQQAKLAARYQPRICGVRACVSGLLDG
jgi:hypothetical protein